MEYFKLEDVEKELPITMMLDAYHLAKLFERNIDDSDKLEKYFFASRWRKFSINDEINNEVDDIDDYIFAKFKEYVYYSFGSYDVIVNTKYNVIVNDDHLHTLSYLAFISNYDVVGLLELYENDTKGNLILDDYCLYNDIDIWSIIRGRAYIKSFVDDLNVNLLKDNKTLIDFNNVEQIVIDVDDDSWLLMKKEFLYKKVLK